MFVGKTMRVLRAASLAFVALMASTTLAFALVRVDIDLNTQTMHVASAVGDDYVWPISSGRHGFPTPTGTYRPQRMMAMAISTKYNNSPMPHSIFFRGGYAIHGTEAVGALGRAASHGCIRLLPAHAAVLYGLVQAEGAIIHITGQADDGMRFASAHKAHRNALAMTGQVPGVDIALGYAPRHRPRGVRQWMLDPLVDQ